MVRKIRVIVGFIIAGIIVGLLMLALGINGPIYRAEVVKLPVNLQTPSEHQAQFTVDRSEEYMVEIHLNTVFPEEKMDKILGDFVAGGGGNIDVSWRVNVDEAVIAQGSSAIYGYSPIWGGGRSGLAIGTFRAEKDKNYTIYIVTKNESIDWNQADPYIEVGLHPGKLESYLVLQIFGLLIASLLGVVLVVVAIVFLVAKRNMASNNNGSQPTR
jgi:hypothetical protein